MVWSLHLPCFR
uniref:Uncharacterized protein n=1 Tax=Arundo donax TaxID=35708 RepID=A0A0A9AMD8_ARUDO